MWYCLNRLTSTKLHPDLTGFPDGPPVKTGNSIADLAAGTMAAHGIVLALFARERTGAGQKVEVGAPVCVKFLAVK